MQIYSMQQGGARWKGNRTLHLACVWVCRNHVPHIVTCSPNKRTSLIRAITCTGRQTLTLHRVRVVVCRRWNSARQLQHRGQARRQICVYHRRNSFRISHHVCIIRNSMPSCKHGPLARRMRESCVAWRRTRACLCSETNRSPPPTTGCVLGSLVCACRRFCVRCL